MVGLQSQQSQPRCGCGCTLGVHFNHGGITGCHTCTETGRICAGFKLAEIGKPVEASAVNHPSYYGGESNPYEAIRVIENWQLDFCLGNAVKYISRAGKKDPTKEIEDLEKAAWYLNRRIEQLKTK